MISKEPRALHAVENVQQAKLGRNARSTFSPHRSELVEDFETMSCFNWDGPIHRIIASWSSLVGWLGEKNEPSFFQ